MCKSFRISSKICPIYPIFVLAVKNIPQKKTIESIYTGMTYFQWHDPKSLHRLISDDAKKTNDVVTFDPVLEIKLIYTYRVKK